MGIAKGVLWWVPGFPVYSKLAYKGKDRAEGKTAGIIARMMALNVCDPARLHSLFNDTPSAVDQATTPLPPAACPESDPIPSEPQQVRVSDANMEQLGGEDKGEVVRT